ncbi:MAG: polyprenyl synthetase family protein [Candidatus Parcubacteria bacterium]|nr:polyprenyl synthetase family protein [Candidatus Parcubacteria bacterium]
MPKNKQYKYGLYLASGITLWKKEFNKKYSEFFNKKVYLFEPGTLDNPDDHRFIPIGIACYDLNEINHADALLVFMKYYKTLDGSPIGTDSTWECGYGISKSKPVIMIIEDEDHMDYYAYQWMVSFSINAILTKNKALVEKLKDHPKFVHTTILLAQDEKQFESKIIDYLDNYYRSIYSRSGVINFSVDEQAREIFSRENLKNNIYSKSRADETIAGYLEPLEKLEFKSDKDSLLVCRVERKISEYLKNNLTEEKIDGSINAVLKTWNADTGHTLDCLEHSIRPPFIKVDDRHSGIKKVRPELFYELYDLVTHHLISKQRFIKDSNFPYQVGAVLELYNWMNTYALDDVFDNSKYRQKLETIWNKFNRRDAIFTGIIGHLLTLKYCFIVAKENPKIYLKMATILNDYNHTMYEGQVLDLILTFDSEKKKKLLKNNQIQDSISLYVQRIYGICGGFFEAIGNLASQTGNKEAQIYNAKEVDKLSPLAGMYYGIIQMIRNDLGDYVITEEITGMSKGMKGISHSDIVEGKANIAYLVALYSPLLSKKEKDFLYKILHTNLGAKDKLKINELLWKSGAIDLTVELIINLINHVKNTIIPQYHETPTRMKWLFSLVDITKEILIPFKEQALKHSWVKYEFDPELLKDITEEILSLENKTTKERLNKLQEFKSLM